MKPTCPHLIVTCGNIVDSDSRGAAPARCYGVCLNPWGDGGAGVRCPHLVLLCGYYGETSANLGRRCRDVLCPA